MVFSMDDHGVTERLVDSNLWRSARNASRFLLESDPSPAIEVYCSGNRWKIPQPGFPFRGYQMERDDVRGFRSGLTGGRVSQSKAFIGDMVSLIYSPFLVKDDTLFDAILDSPAPDCTGKPPEDLPLEPDPECKIRFIPTLCPECGWDLAGDKNALVLLCANCDSAWQAAGGSFEKVDFGFIPGNDGVSLYLPFWRIQAQFQEPNSDPMPI